MSQNRVVVENKSVLPVLVPSLRTRECGTGPGKAKRSTNEAIEKVLPTKLFKGELKKKKDNVKSVPMTSKVCEKEKHSQQDAAELTALASKKAKRDSAASTSNEHLHTSKASSDSTVVKSLNHIMLQLADIKHLIMSTQPQNNKYPEIGLDAGRAESSLSELKPTGCWLGNPAATDAKQRVWTTRTTPDKLASAEFTAKNAPKLALNLMWALFSDDELVNGCCTPSPAGYKILDQTIIGGIRMHINYKFPASSLDDEKIRWKSILQGNMNAKCRSLRSRSPKFVKVQPTVFDATHDDGGCHAGLRDAAHDDGGCRTGLRDAAHDDGGCHAVLTDESEDTAVVFSDDTSGNKSKIWNKFDSYCIRLAGLSVKSNAQIHNIHFICTSNKAPVMEMAVPLVHELQSLEEGILMFDALFNTNVIVIAPVISFLCDNPRAAEICNHRGSSTHKFCRICMADVRSDHICVGVKRKKHDSLMQVQRKKAAKTHQAKSTIRTECGDDLVRLYESAEVQEYLYGIDSKQNKHIHKPGTLRKLSIAEVGERQVTSGSAIVGSDGFLINICDFIQHKSQANITEIGLLVACFQVDMATFCVVRHMEPVLTPEGAPVLNEFECPLMTHTNILRFIPSEDVKTSVSLVHQYDLRCKAMNTITATTVERHKISVTKTVFHHNWNNDISSTFLALQDKIIRGYSNTTVQGVLGKVPGALKPLYIPDLPVNDIRKEAVARGIAVTGKNRATLQKELQEILQGVQRVPSLLLLQPDESLTNLNLQYYKVMDCEPLHDIKGHLLNLFQELPSVLPTSVKHECVNQINMSLKKKKITASDLRSTLVRLFLQTVSTSASPSSLSKLASGPTGRRLRASVLPWSDVFRYSIEYWYWLSIKAHRASLLAARAGVGPNRAVSGLWSVTRMNVRPYKNWWNLLRAKIMASASFLTSQQSPPKDVNALTWDEIVEYTKGQFDPTRYVVSERFKYWSSMSRMPGESIQELAARIRHDAVKCNFPAIRDPLDEAMRTRFMCSVSNEAVLKALFKYKEEELTFAKTIAVAMETEEAAKVAKETVYGTKTSPVHKVDYMRRSRSPDSGENPTSYARDKRRDFPLGTCPRCGKSDHRSQIVLSGMPLVERYEVANGQPLPTLGIFSTIVTLLGEDSSDGKAVEFTVTKVRRLNLLGRDAIVRLQVNISALMGLPSVNRQSGTSTIRPIFSDLKPDLALQKACEQLCREFPDLFKLELVCLKDFQLEVKFKPDAKPIFCKLRVVPFAIQKDLCQAYDAGIARGVWLTTQFNDYGTPVVPIRKAQLHKN
ncbi:hypothetical protein EMCRGX_G003686 [Ephydatia muelleri]